MARRSKRNSSKAYTYSLVLLGFVVVGLLTFTNLGSAMLSLVGQKPECDIKGNVSSTGERIYHVPGGRWYSKTKISQSKGERWFCDEAEARAAGWRRSRR